MPETESSTTRSKAELIDRLFSLSNRCAIGDESAMLELLHCYDDNAEMTPMVAAVPKIAGSPEQIIRSYFEDVARKFYVWIIYADEIKDHGDSVLVLGGIRTVERETRDDRETAVGWIFKVRDDKVEAVRAFSSYADAIAAARAG